MVIAGVTRSYVEQIRLRRMGCSNNVALAPVGRSYRVRIGLYRGMEFRRCIWQKVTIFLTRVSHRFNT